MTVDSRVSLIMTEDVVSIGPDTPVDEIARLMWENNLGTLPVVENQRLIIRSIDGEARAARHKAKFAKAKARVHAKVGTALKKLAK